MDDRISFDDVQKIVEALEQQDTRHFENREFKYVWPTNDIAVLASKNFGGKHYCPETNTTYVNGERINDE